MQASPRVVVADDSSFMRAVLSHGLRGAGFDVVAAARDGDEALAACAKHQPDVLTLDLAMPGKDGMGVLHALSRPGAPDMPVVVVSAFSPAAGARAVDCLAAGAFDLVAKPDGKAKVDGFTDELAEKVSLAARSGRRARIAPVLPRRRSHTPRRAGTRVKRLVVITTSTGGPKALARVVPMLPGRLGAGTLIVQHMPAGFTSSLAARLDGSSKLEVREARESDSPRPGTALLAPGGRHLRLRSRSQTALSDDDAVGGLRPRADLTIEDAARAYGDRLLLVVLTGMGNDGLAGARAVKERGGRVIVEAESSCTVYGMPRVVAEAGLADEELALDDIAAAVAQEAGS